MEDKINLVRGPINKIFVYGTLKEGFRLHRIIKPFIVEKEEAYIKGSLYDTSYGYPVVFEGEDKVYGEVYTVKNTEELLNILDEVEGVPKGAYIRKIITVYTPAGVKKAYAYIGNPMYPPFSKEKLTYIPSGRWE